MSKTNNFLAGLLLGAAAGTAIVLFLNSEKGKAMMNDIKDGADNMQTDLTAMVDGLVEKGKSFVNEFEQKAGQPS
jgi:gas vesicle protein